ncbi:hypothetical protein KPH14_012705 [Odynerus spinipes]|uniref:Endonuclease/exonuclease/phosphatase domain-containing protein n=1 Tax=Odynerus spinipes TaxID=1348599 RepID=A0AAD9VK98_9HYME|nr:hypothetical protein KPH14_012705 [Odynerus spinipes]
MEDVNPNKEERTKVRKAPIKKSPPIVIHGRIGTHAKFLESLKNIITYKFHIKYHKDKTEVFTTINLKQEKPAKCINCEGDHPANTTICQAYQERVNWIKGGRKPVGLTRTSEGRPAQAPNISYVKQFPTLRDYNSEREGENYDTWGNRVNKISNKWNQVPKTGQSELDDFYTLTRKLKEINKLCNIKEMLNMVREFKRHLIVCKTKGEQFQTFINFCDMLDNQNGKDVTDNSTGGILVCIKNGLSCKEIKINNQVSIECIGLRLPNKTYLVAAYNKPKNFFGNRELDLITNIGSKVILVGDLNARHTSWNNHSSNSQGTKIFKYILNNTCSILYPNKPTHYPSNGSTPSTTDIAL